MASLSSGGVGRARREGAAADGDDACVYGERAHIVGKQWMDLKESVSELQWRRSR